MAVTISMKFALRGFLGPKIISRKPNFWDFFTNFYMICLVYHACYPM